MAITNQQYNYELNIKQQKICFEISKSILKIHIISVVTNRDVIPLLNEF